ncbi:MAG: type II toxin-antitoxin system HicA family toxin [Betaproteobacteria bacterium]|nr:type II toxin-antitoxin system HicA family toxin [Betaproteobacteria bacterium]
MVTTTKREKLLEKARNHPKGLAFSEFETLLRQNGWTFDHQTGSHRIWRSSNGVVISLQKGRDGKGKGYQVEQFLKHVE